MILTAQGFKRKTYEEFLKESEQQARELFGANVNLTDRSPLGQWIKLISFQRAEENELTEAVYNSAYVDAATGISLDYAVKYKGITRFPKKAAKGPVQLSVDPGLTVQPGLLVGTQDDIAFFVTDAATDSDNDGFLFVNVEAVEPGSSGNVPAGTITQILTPITGVASVTNLEATKSGQDKETDSELLNRYYATSGQNATPEGIASKMINTVDGVRAAIVIENYNGVADGAGRPPHCFETIVLGGQAEDIGAAILSVKPPGIRAYGSQSVVAKDSAGNEHTIGFSYATPQNIFVNIILSKNVEFPSDGTDIIKRAVIKYIGGEDEQGNHYTGLGMGESVIFGQISKIVFGMDGVDDAAITLSKDGTSYSAGNVVINATTAAQTSFEKVVITFE